MKRALAVLAFVSMVAPLTAQEVGQQGNALRWPDYAEQQRWNRLNVLSVSFTTGAIAYGKARGQSLDEIGRYFGDLYAPGWGPANSGVPVRVARGFVFNLAATPNSEAQLVAATDTSATMRYSRVHVARFGQSGEMYGVTVAEYERFFDVLGERIANHLGLRYSARVDGEWMDVTFTGRGANAVAAFPRSGTFTTTLTAEQAGSPALAGTFDLSFAPDGSFELKTTGGPSRVRGRYNVWLDQMDVGEETGEWACRDAPSGSYRFIPQANGDIVFGRLADECQGRGRFFARRWTKK